MCSASKSWRNQAISRDHVASGGARRCDLLDNNENHRACGDCYTIFPESVDPSGLLCRQPAEALALGSVISGLRSTRKELIRSQRTRELIPGRRMEKNQCAFEPG